jgi:hypothetical protein
LSKRPAFTAAVLAAAFGLAAAAPVDDLSAADGGKWIVDEQTGCATSNPSPTLGESVRWYGLCRDGRLHGHGTLIWYRDGVETGRNEGVFRDGLLDGDAVTSYPNGHVLIGQYRAGRRHGQFVAIMPDGAHIQASYADGKLQSQRKLSDAEVAAWQRRRPGALPDGAPTAPPRPDPPTAATQRPAVAPTGPRPTQWGVPAARARSEAPSVAVDGRPTTWSVASPPPPSVTVPPSDRPPLIGSGRADARPFDSAASADRHGAPYAAAAGVRYAATPTRTARLYAGAGGTGSPRRDPAAGGSSVNSATADRLFTQGYQLERAGRLDQAARTYERILLEYPSAPSAVLANARLEALRRPDREALAAGIEPAAGPSGAAYSPNGHAPRNGGGLDAPPPSVGRGVCTRDGLYEGGARWCGIVTGDEGSHVQAEVRQLELPGFGTIGISRSRCTGDTLVTWFSRGTTLRVPKQCLTFEG